MAVGLDGPIRVRSRFDHIDDRGSAVPVGRNRWPTMLGAHGIGRVEEIGDPARRGRPRAPRPCKCAAAGTTGSLGHETAGSLGAPARVVEALVHAESEAPELVGLLAFATHGAHRDRVGHVAVGRLFDIGQSGVTGSNGSDRSRLRR